MTFYGRASKMATKCHDNKTSNQSVAALLWVALGLCVCAARVKFGSGGMVPSRVSGLRRPVFRAMLTLVRGGKPIAVYVAESVVKRGGRRCVLV